MPDINDIASNDCTIWGWRWGLRPGPRDSTPADWRYMLVHKFLINEYFSSGDQPETLKFCETVDPIREPAIIDFCDILNTNGI